ncbi:MAG: gamma-glutamylcyclotransferase [Burkholderiales bacterium]
MDISLTRRDPEEMLLRATAQWGGRDDLWVFGYASLIARPEFEATEHRVGHVHGWHRALRMRSRVNRGTPELPGLVFALLPGGSCHGVAYRVPRRRAAAELERLWRREMPSAVYDPRWLPCRTSHGEVRALAFTLSRRSPSFVETLADRDLLHVFKHAKGRFGTTLDYLIETAEALRRRGLRDREIERMVDLARSHALV